MFETLKNVFRVKEMRRKLLYVLWMILVIRIGSQLPVPEGTGVIAGGPARAVIELAGIKNIRTKCMGSRNKQNVVLATIEGLRQLKTPEEVARLRGKSVDEILA